MSEKHLTTGDTLPPLEPGRLRLYSMRFCPFAMRTRLVLAAKKINYERVNINLASKPDWFLTKNAGGTVPVLEQDDRILTESLITSDYLEEAYPHNKLYPQDPYLKARQRMLVDNFSEINGLISKVLYMKPETRKDAIEALQKGFDKLEKYEDILKVSGKQYFRGDTPGMVDYVLFPFFLRLDLGKDFIGPEAEFPKDKLPVLAAWIERMKKDPVVIECSLPRDVNIKFFKGLLEGRKDFDI